MQTPSLFTKRLAYKPFWYPWAYKAFTESEQMHWLVREVPLNADVQEKQLQLQLIAERVQAAAQERNQQFIESMRQSLSDAISDVVAEGGYDLVLNAASVAYADPVLDITPKVTAKINEINPTGGR